MVKSVTFEGIKYSYRQTKDGHVLAFVVHPKDLNDAVVLAPIGARVKVTLADITDEPEPKQEKPKTPFNQMSRAQQAGILCADKQFQKWMGWDNEESTAIDVRAMCGVKTRADLDVFQKSGQQWDSLVMNYRIATGQQAEPR